MYKPRYYRRRKYLRRTKKGTKKSCKLSKCMKKEVQKLISKNIEDKIAYSSTGDSIIWCNSGINSSGDINQCVPSILVGSTESHRVGCRIRAKTLVIKGMMQLALDTTVNDLSNKRVGVRLIVYGSKKQKNIDDLKANAGAALIQKGATSQTFNGYVSDLWAPINREEYTPYYDKVHYLSQSYVRQNIGSSTPTTEYAIDNSKGIRFFTIRIPVKGKMLMFDTGTSTGNATNWSCGLALGYAHLDASSPDVATTKVGIVFDTTFTYEDA